MPRPTIFISEKELIESILKFEGQRGKLFKVAEDLGISHQTVYSRMREYGLDTKAAYKTPKIATDINWQEMLEEAKGFASLQDAIGQTEVEIEIPDDFILYIIADAHIGNIHTDLDELYEDVDTIKDHPVVYTAIEGDMIDNFIVGHSPGVGFQEQVLSPIKQRKRAEAIVKRLSDKLLWIIQGDHDDWSYGIDGFDMSEYMSEKCSGYWLGFGGIVNLTVGENTHRLYAVHRTQRGTTVGIRDVAWGLKYDRMYKYDFNIGITAHLHRPGVTIENYKGQRVYYINCGTYKLFDRYGKKKGFRKCDPDKPTLIFRKDKDYIETYMNLKDAIQAF